MLDPQLVVIGPHSVPRLPVFSFLVRHQDSGRYLHHNFVCAVLNDVFGVQARGGCSCAGPYTQVRGVVMGVVLGVVSDRVCIIMSPSEPAGYQRGIGS